MRKQSFALLVLVAACSSAPRLPSSPHGEPVLEVRGAVKDGPYALGAADLGALPRRDVRGTDPVTGRTARWEGPALATLASGRVQLARGADTVIVRTADRMAIPIPLTVVRQLGPVLADHADGVALPDRIIAWPTADQGGLETDPRARAWWARRVTALELVNGWTVYGRALAVPSGAADGARPGADLFGARCITCHRLRRAGGENGPDLTRVADRIAPDAFQALLSRHAGWAVPGLTPPSEDAERVWAFLHAVSVEAATGPVEDQGPPPELPRERNRERPPEMGRVGR